MCILDLNMCNEMIEELNREMVYKLSNDTPINKDTELLTFITDAKDHRILFLGQVIWSCEREKQMENIPLEKDMSLNEREKFEPHIRALIMDQINLFKNLEV